MTCRTYESIHCSRRMAGANVASGEAGERSFYFNRIFPFGSGRKVPMIW